ncbi:MAG: CCA tRNA nucleotidyltransferase [Verrucomicrobia bacterium]|nr:CCA tRNA nucleotidyltransferase [Verrucomicrobiota bacterium]
MALTAAKKIVESLAGEGYIAYFAGGWVRDLVMQHPSHDIDIVTSAPIEVIQTLFSKTIPLGVAFGIVVVVMDGHSFEVATFRKEVGYKDGRRPDRIESATPEEDAQRRDFTINGMFYDPLKEILYDYVGGQEDLKKEVIRAIGNPHERFLEDRLRMVRAVRYASRFRFAIDPDTIQAILAHAEDLFPAVAIERIWQELKKMAAFSRLEEGLALLHRFNLLGVIFPALKDTPLDEIEANISKMARFPKEAPLIAYIYELFPNASLKERLLLVEYLKLSKEERLFTEELEKWRFPACHDDYDWVKLYALPNSSICLAIESLHKEDPTYKKVHLERMERLSPAIERRKNRKTLLTSEHLRAHGVPSGKALGLLLEEGERLSVNENIKEPEAVLKRLTLPSE